MRTIIPVILLTAMSLLFSCKQVQNELKYPDPDMRIIFLHHSTGNNVWSGDVDRSARLHFKEKMSMVPRLIKEYNEETGSKISIEERAFPKGSPYPWQNYPYDYYNIWVKNAGPEPYMEEPTLEMLTKEYDMIIFKYCFPYSNIQPDDGNPDINSQKKTLANYKLQYNALREKLHEFPDTRFLVWTGAAQVESQVTEDQAKRAREITQWVKEEWDVTGDNIEIFEFRELATGGGLYLKAEYAVGPEDSHPNMNFSTIAANAFADRIIEVATE